MLFALQRNCGWKTGGMWEEFRTPLPNFSSLYYVIRLKREYELAFDIIFCKRFDNM